jgi:hypothetical protein
MWTSKVSGVSFIYKVFRIGARTKLCGTPAYISRGVDILSSSVTVNFLLESNDIISLIMLAEKCNLEGLCNNPGCHVVSKAFSISKNNRGHIRIVIEMLRSRGP